MEKGNSRRTKEKIGIFMDLFTGLSHVYGTYNPTTGRARQVKAPVTEQVVLDHLTGKKPYGVYLLVKDRTNAIAVDFDTKDKTVPMEFVARARHYGIATYIERSKSKGYHVWIFFEKKGLPAFKPRLVVRHILGEIEKQDTEIFPKQDRLDNNSPFGNYINTPLYGRIVPEGKTVFVDPTTFDPYPDQWALLESVTRIREPDLDEIIEINDLSLLLHHMSSGSINNNRNQNPFSLPPCAKKMLQEGVSQYQRVSCFRLAVHLKRLGLPYDMAIVILKTWASKNHPTNGDIITEAEVLSQSSYAYKHSYAGYGCDSPAMTPFCEPTCPVKKWREINEKTSSGKKGNKSGMIKEDNQPGNHAGSPA